MAPNLEAFSVEVLQYERTFQDLLQAWRFSTEDLTLELPTFTGAVLLGLEYFKPGSDTGTLTEVSVRGKKLLILEVERRLVSILLSDIKVNVRLMHIIFKQYVISQHCSTKFRTYILSSEAVKYPSECLEREIIKDFEPFYFNERTSILQLLLEVLVSHTNQLHPRHSLGVSLYSTFVGEVQGSTWFDRLLSQIYVISDLQILDGLKSVELVPRAIKELQLLLELLNYILFCGEVASERFITEFIKWALETYMNKISWLKTFNFELINLFTRTDGLILAALLYILDFEHIDYQCDQASDCSPRLLKNPNFLLSLLKYAKKTLGKQHSLFSLGVGLFCRGIYESFQEKLSLGEPVDASSLALMKFLTEPNTASSTNAIGDQPCIGLADIFFNYVDTKSIFATLQDILKPNFISGEFPSTCKKPILCLLSATIIFIPDLAFLNYQEFQANLCLLFTSEPLLCESVWQSQQISKRAVLSLAQSTYPTSANLLPELVQSMICNEVTAKAGLLYLSSLTSFSEKFDPELRNLTRCIPAHDSIFEANQNIPTILTEIPKYTRGSLTKINGEHILIWSHDFNAWECLQDSLLKLACFNGENDNNFSSEHNRLLNFIQPLLNIFCHLTKIAPEVLEVFPNPTKTTFPLSIVQDLLVICDGLVSIANPPLQFICLVLEISCYYIPNHPTLWDFLLVKLANSENFGKLSISTLTFKENSSIFDQMISLTRIVNIFIPVYFQIIQVGNEDEDEVVNHLVPLSELILKSIKVMSGVFFTQSHNFEPTQLETINRECLKILALFFDACHCQNIVPELDPILELISFEFFDSDKVYYLAYQLLRVILMDQEFRDPEYLAICLKFTVSLLRLMVRPTCNQNFQSHAFIITLLSYISPLQTRLIPTIFSYVKVDFPHLSVILELIGLLATSKFQSELGSFASQLLEEGLKFEKNLALIAMGEISDEYLVQTLWYSLSGLVTHQHELFPSLFNNSLEPHSLAKSIEFAANNWSKTYLKFPKVALSFSHFLAVLWRQRSCIVSGSIQSPIWALINNVLTHDSYLTDQTVELRAIQANFITVVKLEANYLKSSDSELELSFKSLFSNLTSPEYVDSIVTKWGLLLPQPAAMLALVKDLNSRRVSVNVLENFQYYSDPTLGWLGRKETGLFYNLCKFKASFLLTLKKVDRLLVSIQLVDQVAFIEQSRHSLMLEWSSFYQLAFDTNLEKLFSSSNSFNASLFCVIQTVQNILKTPQRPFHLIGYTSLLQMVSKVLESVHPQCMVGIENQNAIVCLTVVLLNALLSLHNHSLYIQEPMLKLNLTNTSAIYRSLGFCLQLLLINTSCVDNFHIPGVANLIATDFELFSNFETESCMMSLVCTTRSFHLETVKLLLSIDNLYWRTSLNETELLKNLISTLYKPTNSQLLVHQILEILCRMAPSIPSYLVPEILNFNLILAPPSTLSQCDILNDSDKLKSYSYVAFLDLSAQLNLDLGPINSTLESLVRSVSSQDFPLQAVQLACIEAFLRVYIQGGLVSGAGHINLLQLTSALISYIKGERLTLTLSEYDYVLMRERGPEANPLLTWVYNCLYILLNHLLKSDTHTSKPFIAISCISNSDFSFGSLLDVLKIFSPLTYASDKLESVKLQASDLVLACLNLLVAQLLSFLNYEGFPVRLQQEVLYDIQTELQFYLDSAPDAITCYLSNHNTEDGRYRATLNNLVKAWIDTKAILTKVSEFH